MPALTVRVRDIANSIFDPPDLLASSLDDRLRVRSAAAIVLSHAEIEEEIESACLSAVKVLEGSPPVGFSFLAWGLATVRDGIASEAEIARQVKSGSSTKYLAKAYRDVVDNSHGISEKHLQKMLLPLGVDLNPLTVEISVLHAFGKLRGSAAHLSPLKARLQNAPSAVVTEINSAALAATSVVASVTAVAAAISSGTPPSRRRKWLFWG